MNLKLLHIFLLSTAGTFLLCTPFITYGRTGKRTGDRKNVLVSPCHALFFGLRLFRDVNQKGQLLLPLHFQILWYYSLQGVYL